MLRKKVMHVSVAQRNKDKQTKRREKIVEEDSKNDTFYNTKIKLYN